jgi:SAM-dependent methyltransferase
MGKSMRSEARSYYNSYWSPSGFSPVGMGLPETLRAVFTRHVQPSDRAIDIGCGDGSKVGDWLSRHAASYVGFDVAEEAVRLARARGLDAELVDDASALPLPDRSAEVAVCAEVLEHLFDPFAAVVEIGRVLSPGGRLIVTVPNIVNWRSRLDFALLGRWHPGGDQLSVEKPWRDPHIRFFTPRALVGLLHEAGLEVVEFGGLQDVSAAFRLPIARRLLGDRPAGRPTRLLVRLAPGLFSNQLYAVAKT